MTLQGQLKPFIIMLYCQDESRNWHQNMPKFDYTDIAATHKIMKRDVGIAYIAMRKIHYNVMRFRDTVSLDEAEVLAGRFKSVSARYYVLHDPEKLTDKYITAWSNFGINVSHTSI
jgi:hypothetical protein